MTTTPNLQIDHIAANQAQKEVTANTAFDVLDKALCGLSEIALEDANLVLTDEQMLWNMALSFTGTLTATRTITVPVHKKLLFIQNNTDGGFGLSVKTPLGESVSINAGANKLFYCDGTDLIIVAEAGLAAPYDIGGTLNGKPPESAVLLRYPMPRAVRFKTGLSGSQGVAGEATTNAATFSIQKNGSNFALMSFAIGANTATFTCTEDTDFAAGDVLTVIAPTLPDDTLADIGFSLSGIRL